MRSPTTPGLREDCISHSAHVANGLPAPGGAYSHVTQTDQLVFTAGFGPPDPETGRLPKGIGAHTEATLANVERVLAVVGLDLSHVLKATAHLAHLERDFAAFDAAYRRRMPQPYQWSPLAPMSSGS